MAILMWTLSILMILSGLTYTRLENHVYSDFALNLYLKNRCAQRDQESCLQEERYCVAVGCGGSERPDKAPALPHPGNRDIPEKIPQEKKQDLDQKLYLDFPPHNARLNLAVLFRNKSPDQEFYQTLFTRLLYDIYHDKAFFNGVDHAEERLVEALLDKATLSSSTNKQQLKSAEDLALLILDDPELQELLYHVLKGGMIGLDKDRTREYPSILEFVILEPQRKKYKISIHHAPYELLVALFEDERIAQAVVEHRNELHRRGESVNKTGLLVTDLYLHREDLEQILNRFGQELCDYEMAIDFSPRKPAHSELLPHLR